MIVSNPPQITVADFKWRWATVTPTETLNRPSVFLGVLRALHANEGKSPSHSDVFASLKSVEIGLSLVTPKLARDPTRNLMRHSGQYWKALGVLESTDPAIQLTSFGRRVATGQLTSSEFAAAVVATLLVPNPLIESSAKVSQWNAAGIKIKALLLVLEILSELGKSKGHEYLTDTEFLRVVIPLSAVNANAQDHADTILAVRKGTLNVSTWPNCTPAANDSRMVREFLLFLIHHGYIVKRIHPTSAVVSYALLDAEAADVDALNTIGNSASNLDDAVQQVTQSQIPATTDRRRILREVLTRPQQAKFRKDVFSAASCVCLFTGVQLRSVLEAAHIVPVASGGADSADNGFCLRSDVHILFDAGHIRIEPSGRLHVSAQAKLEPIYAQLPQQIAVPAYVGKPKLEWRWKYQ